MGKWTRRDLVKAGLAASAGVMAGGELVAEPRESRLAGAAPAPAQIGAATNAADRPGTPRERLLLDFGWRFALGNACDPDKDFGFGKLRGTGTFAKAGSAGGPAAPRFDDSAWRKIDLPHDWAVELPFVNERTLIGHGAKPLGREYPGDQHRLVSTRVRAARERRGTPHLGGVRRDLSQCHGVLQRPLYGHQHERVCAPPPGPVGLCELWQWDGGSRGPAGCGCPRQQRAGGAGGRIAGRGVVLRGRGNLSPCVADQDGAGAHRALGQLCADGIRRGNRRDYQFHGDDGTGNRRYPE